MASFALKVSILMWVLYKIGTDLCKWAGFLHPFYSTLFCCCSPSPESCRWLGLQITITSGLGTINFKGKMGLETIKTHLTDGKNSTKLSFPPKKNVLSFSFLFFKGKKRRDDSVWQTYISSAGCGETWRAAASYKCPGQQTCVASCPLPKIPSN